MHIKKIYHILYILTTLYIVSITSVSFSQIKKGSLDLKNHFFLIVSTSYASSHSKNKMDVFEQVLADKLKTFLDSRHLDSMISSIHPNKNLSIKQMNYTTMIQKIRGVNPIIILELSSTQLNWIVHLYKFKNNTTQLIQTYKFNHVLSHHYENKKVNYSKMFIHLINQIHHDIKGSTNKTSNQKNFMVTNTNTNHSDTSKNKLTNATTPPNRDITFQASFGTMFPLGKERKNNSGLQLYSSVGIYKQINSFYMVGPKVLLLTNTYLVDNSLPAEMYHFGISLSNALSIQIVDRLTFIQSINLGLVIDYAKSENLMATVVSPFFNPSIELKIEIIPDRLYLSTQFSFFFATALSGNEQFYYIPNISLYIKI